ncbi:hypothetical protein SETIT_7G007100v2 [Setaria italica]|uniref:Uncharacterized protein n=1 Tax=Setaria italica TaxID=4555 RepID=A0A368RQP4_SETIT|nr:hypothetical protein SETIT_7G007100v2 [Setaria italica]RCV32492.1 hypothetical protein SETIT_7G007100v2 [Setaria italica]
MPPISLSFSTSTTVGSTGDRIFLATRSSPPPVIPSLTSPLAFHELAPPLTVRGTPSASCVRCWHVDVVRAGCPPCASPTWWRHPPATLRAHHWPRDAVPELRIGRPLSARCWPPSTLVAGYPRPPRRWPSTTPCRWPQGMRGGAWERREGRKGEKCS